MAAMYHGTIIWDLPQIIEISSCDETKVGFEDTNDGGGGGLV